MLDGIDVGEFAPGATLAELYQERYQSLPVDAGVYLVVRDSTDGPSFAQESPLFLQALRDRTLAPQSAAIINEHLALVKKTYGVYRQIEIVDLATEKVAYSTDTTNLQPLLPLKRYQRMTNDEQTRESLIVAKDRQDQLVLIVSRVIPPTSDTGSALILDLLVDSDEIIRPMLSTGDRLGSSGESVMGEAE